MPNTVAVPADSISARDFGIIGESEAIMYVFQKVCKVAPTDADVLLIGESGTGKELFARAIHKLSKRNNNPFIALNCGSLPVELAESELFGHVAGAFSGAIYPKHGLLASASSGTCLLDEAGELNIDLQVKLLRFLEDRTIRKVGSTTFESVEVRIIAATNRDLELEVANGKFRESLYYRLKHVEIRIPPLRERREDIPLLIEHFLSHYKPPKSIDRSVIQIMMDYDWPGNIRELKNVIDHMVILCDDKKVTFKDLPSNMKRFRFNKSKDIVSNEKLCYPIKQDSLKSHIEWYERNLIIQALSETNGNQNKAAKILKLSKQLLNHKIKKYQINTTQW